MMGDPTPLAALTLEQLRHALSQARLLRAEAERNLDYAVAVRTVALLAEKGVVITGVTRGQRLEERVLQGMALVPETRAPLGLHTRSKVMRRLCQVLGSAVRMCTSSLHMVPCTKSAPMAERKAPAAVGNGALPAFSILS